MTTRAKRIPPHIQREINRMGVEAGRIQRQHRRRTHTRRTRHGVVQVSQAVVRTHAKARDLPYRTAGAYRALTAPGTTRDRAVYAAKLGVAVGVPVALAVGWVAGQVASGALALTAAIAIGVLSCLWTVAWVMLRKMEPRWVRCTRTTWHQAKRALRPHLRAAVLAYAGTRQKTTAKTRRGRA